MRTIVKGNLTIILIKLSGISPDVSKFITYVNKEIDTLQNSTLIVSIHGSFNLLNVAQIADHSRLKDLNFKIQYSNKLKNSKGYKLFNQLPDKMKDLVLNLNLLISKEPCLDPKDIEMKMAKIHYFNERDFNKKVADLRKGDIYKALSWIYQREPNNSELVRQHSQYFYCGVLLREKIHTLAVNLQDLFMTGLEGLDTKQMMDNPHLISERMKKFKYFRSDVIEQIKEEDVRSALMFLKGLYIDVCREDPSDSMINSLFAAIELCQQHRKEIICRQQHREKIHSLSEHIGAIIEDVEKENVEESKSKNDIELTPQIFADRMQRAEFKYFRSKAIEKIKEEDVRAAFLLLKDNNPVTASDEKMIGNLWHSIRLCQETVLKIRMLVSNLKKASENQAVPETTPQIISDGMGQLEYFKSDAIEHITREDVKRAVLCFDNKYMYAYTIEEKINLIFEAIQLRLQKIKIESIPKLPMEDKEDMELEVYNKGTKTFFNDRNLRNYGEHRKSEPEDNETTEEFHPVAFK